MYSLAKYSIENGKLKGFSGGETDGIELRKLFDYILVEADGSKSRPVKAPAEWEPVYPALTRLILGVVGLDCLGKPVAEENVHRSALFMQIAGAGPEDLITAGHLFQLIHHPLGLFRHAPQGVQRVVLFNKADLAGNPKKEITDLQRNADYPVFYTSRDFSWADDFIQRFLTGTKG
jgi:probable selenium-dependent hydroxylase accessory protein YqeC